MTTTDAADVELVQRLVSILGTGKGAALSGQTIARALDLDTRAVRALVNLAIDGGTLVCSCHRGYFRPATWEESTDTIAYLQAEVRARLHRINATLNLAGKQFNRPPTADAKQLAAHDLSL